jgi:hypothetical protein
MNQVLQSCNQVSCERVFNPHRVGQPLFSVQELSTFLKAACEALQAQQSCSKRLSISLESVLDDRRGSVSNCTIALPLSTPANQPEQLFLTVLQGLTKLYSPGEQYLKCRVDFLELIPEDAYKLFEQTKPRPRSRFSWQKDVKNHRPRFSTLLNRWDHGMQEQTMFTRVNLR